MKQGYNDRLDESLSRKDHCRKGKKQEGQSYKSRRHESEGMEKHYGKGKYAGDKSMKHG